MARETVDRIDTQEAALQHLSNLETKWRAVSLSDGDAVRLIREMSYGELTEACLLSFGLTSQSMEILSDADLNAKTSAVRSEVQLLYHKLRSYPGLSDNPDVSIRINNLFMGVNYAERLVHSASRVKRVATDGGNNILVSPGSFVRIAGLEVSELPFGEEQETNQYQALLLFLLNKSQDLGHFKYRGDMYSQILTSCGRRTYAWRKACSIKEFVYKVTDKETNREAWLNLTHGKGNAESASIYLENCNDLQLPELSKSRNVFAFLNGLYFSKQDVFWTYNSDDVRPTGVSAACKYFDQPFCEFSELHDWYNIPTPNLQRILDFQKFDDAVCRWMYCLLGRLLYDVGDLDGWQVIPFCKGQASSGKSTILLKVAKMFFEQVDVGILSNNIEKKFGLSAFYDKFLFVAPEIKRDLQLEQAEFQSIVSGEDVQIAIKHQKAEGVTWTTPGILAGNEIPNWADNSGSITRRIIVFDFERSVTDGDMELGKKLELELPSLLVKCNRAYLHYVRQVGGDNVWKHLPPYFIRKKHELLASTNSLVAFLTSDLVKLEDESFVPSVEFKASYKNFCADNNLTRPSFQKENLQFSFNQYGLREEMATRSYRGSQITTKFIVGCDLVSPRGVDALDDMDV
jgi:hypothetical protein